VALAVTLILALGGYVAMETMARREAIMTSSTNAGAAAGMTVYL